MSGNRIINNERISWRSEGEDRLNYQMIFEEKDPEQEEQIAERQRADMEKQLAQRDREWKRKLAEARTKAFNEGKELGLRQGYKEAREEIDGKLSVIEEGLRAAHAEWKERQESLEPGLLDLVFDIAESILGIPVENPAIRDQLDTELGELLQKVDKETRPRLLVSERDYEYVLKLKDRHCPNSTVSIRASDRCNPGEFELDTDRETMVRNFQTMLRDFADNLTLPSWK